MIIMRVIFSFLTLLPIFDVVAVFCPCSRTVFLDFLTSNQITKYDTHIKTIDVMEKVQFDSAYTFKYSSRPGTKAAEFEDIISEEEKQSRLKKVIDMQKKHTLSQNQKRVGCVEIVLVEKESKRSANHWAGRTDSNKWVIFSKGNVQIKEMTSVHIKEAKGITLHGELIQDLEEAA